MTVPKVCRTNTGRALHDKHTRTCKPPDNAMVRHTPAATGSSVSVDALLDAAEAARLSGDVDHHRDMNTAALATPAEPAARAKRTVSEPPAASPSKKQKLQLTPREQAQLRLLATVPQLRSSRDARGRRRGVSVDMSAHLSSLVGGELAAQVGDSEIGTPDSRAGREDEL